MFNLLMLKTGSIGVNTAMLAIELMVSVVFFVELPKLVARISLYRLKKAGPEERKAILMGALRRQLGTDSELTEAVYGRLYAPVNVALDGMERQPQPQTVYEAAAGRIWRPANDGPPLLSPTILENSVDISGEMESAGYPTGYEFGPGEDGDELG
jgi:hypothetical protein